MSKVTMYSTQWCPFCQRAEQLLLGKGIEEFTTIDIDLKPAERAAMIARTGRRSVPQIYVGDTHIGGYDDLSELDRNGRLDVLLAQ